MPTGQPRIGRVLPIRVLDNREVDDETARRKLAALRTRLFAVGERRVAEAITDLLTDFSPAAAYRLIFCDPTPENDRGRHEVPPFDPDRLAPPGAKAVPHAHKPRYVGETG